MSQVQLQTEPSSVMVLSKCCNTQTDSVSSVGTEQTDSRGTQTNPVSVLVSRCAQTDPENELDEYPVQLPQMQPDNGRNLPGMESFFER